MEHTPYIQLPEHHHHIHVHAQNDRNKILAFVETNAGRKGIAILITLAILSAILFLGMKLVAGPGNLGHGSSGAEDFSPYTTLVFPVSGLYCESYSMTKYAGSPIATLQWNISMYIVKKIPELSIEHNFSVYRESIVLQPGEFYQWSFTFHAGSRYEASSCVWEGSDAVELHVIQGDSQFKQWVGSGKDTVGMKHILHPCNLVQNSTQWYNISEDDKYYFIYSNLNKNDQLSHVRVNMSFSKFEYSVDTDDVYCQCSCSEEYFACSSCGLPLTFNGYIVLETMPIDDNGTINWEDTLYVTWSCDASYNAYLLVFCLPIMCIAIAVLLCSDLPKMCPRKSSSVNPPIANEQPISPHRTRVLIILLRFLGVMYISLVIMCVILVAFTLILKVVTVISSGIPTLISNNLKLGLLAATAILFVVSILSNKLKGWVQDKVVPLVTRVRLSQVRRNTQQASNTTEANSATDHANSSSTTDAKAYLRFKIAYLLLSIPVIIITVLSVSAGFTFLEAFYPVLATYSSEANSDIYMPGNTHIFSFNSFFCSEYSITSYGSSHLSASLYITESKSVAGNHSITRITSNESISANAPRTWIFYLNKKSTASMKACLDDPIKNATMHLYKYDAYDINQIETYDILDNCSIDLWPLPIGKRSGQASNYLLVLSTESIDSVNVQVDIQLNQYKYFVDHLTSSAQTCSISSHTQNTCTASAPALAGSMTGLISVHSNQPTINLHETISITKSCKYHFATWTILWLPVLVINVVIFSVIIGYVQKLYFKEHQKKLAQRKQTTNETEPLLRPNTNNVYGTNNVEDATAVTTNTSDDRVHNSDPPGNQPEDIDPASNSVTVVTDDAHDAMPTSDSDSMTVPVEIDHEQQPSVHTDGRQGLDSDSKSADLEGTSPVRAPSSACSVGSDVNSNIEG